MANQDISSIYEKEAPMKDVLHRVREAVQGRGKIIVMTERSEDKQCISDVRKKFMYVAKEVDSDGGTAVPQVHIEKAYDSKTKDEFFSMRVRGFFHVYRNRRMVKVGYCHLLKIRLHWKADSPKKPSLSANGEGSLDAE